MVDSSEKPNEEQVLSVLFSAIGLYRLLSPKCYTPPTYHDRPQQKEDEIITAFNMATKKQRKNLCEVRSQENLESDFDLNLVAEINHKMV